jgi:asparagine synthase (glutamine-hydrolysing)
MGGLEVVVYPESNPLNLSIIRSFMIQDHRGPDDSNFFCVSNESLSTNSKYYLTKNQIQTYIRHNYLFMHKKLNINDSSFNSSQPFENPLQSKLLEYPDLKKRPSRYLIANGEIYNYKQLVKDYNITPKDLSSNSDVEVILPLYIYNEYDIAKTLQLLDGDFSFVLLDNPKTFIKESVNLFACRDIFGKKGLYHVYLKDNSFHIFVSEKKSLPDTILKNKSYIIEDVPPGYYYSLRDNMYIKYFQWVKKEYEIVDPYPHVMDTIYSSLQSLINDCIVKMYTSSVPIGILLSDGFGSILLTSVLIEYLSNTYYDFLNKPIHVFSIGNTTEIQRDFINFLEQKYDISIYHHSVNIEAQSIIEKDLKDIVYCLETDDKNTILDSIPMYYLLKYIHKYQPAIKIIFTGDFLNIFTPNDNGEDDVVYKLKNLYKTDLLRTDKISSKWSLEVRHPYLCKNFVDYMLTLHPKFRTCGFYSPGKKIDKYILRKSFQTDVLGRELIPDKFLWYFSKSFKESIHIDLPDSQEYYSTIYSKLF